MPPKSVDILMVELDHLKGDFKELKEILLKHMEHEEAQMTALIDRLENRFSAKWVEKLVAGGIVMLLVAFGTYLGYSVVHTVKEESKVEVSK